MAIFFFVFIALLLIVAAMSIGVIMGGKPISGSCGGMSALGMDTACDICGGDKTICDDEEEKQRRITHLKNLERLTTDATKPSNNT